jgi:hypothetical protein
MGACVAALRRLTPIAWALMAWGLFACSPAPAASEPAEPAEASAPLATVLASPEGDAGLATAEAVSRASPTAPDCVLRATFLQDLAIADNTPLPPSAPFTKSWRLRNDGSCVWDETYGLSFIGGDRMGAASTLPLLHTVLPGGTVDLAVDMIAPALPGRYQGFWKLQDAQGNLFGVGGEGGLSVWVKIEVRPELTGDADSPLPPEPPEGEAFVPAVLITGSAALPPGIAFDLDRGQVQADAGADILWQSELVSQGSAKISRPLPPKEVVATPACEGESLPSAPIKAEDLPPGTTVCFRTDQGRTGSLTIVQAEDALRFDYTTWQASVQ